MLSYPPRIASVEGRRWRVTPTPVSTWPHTTGRSTSGVATSGKTGVTTRGRRRRVGERRRGSRGSIRRGRGRVVPRTTCRPYPGARWLRYSTLCIGDRDDSVLSTRRKDPGRQSVSPLGPLGSPSLLSTLGPLFWTRRDCQLTGVHPPN